MVWCSCSCFRVSARVVWWRAQYGKRSERSGKMLQLLDSNMGSEMHVTINTPQLGWREIWTEAVLDPCTLPSRLSLFGCCVFLLFGAAEKVEDSMRRNMKLHTEQRTDLYLQLSPRLLHSATTTTSVSIGTSTALKKHRPFARIHPSLLLQRQLGTHGPIETP